MYRILLFSYLSHDQSSYKGGGWVKSFAQLLASSNMYEVAIAYISNIKKEKYVRENVVYYPIYKKRSLLNKIYYSIRREHSPVQAQSEVDFIIEDFSPDLIQLFGIETPFGSILFQTKGIPIVVHIQGICTSICEKWFPMGFSKNSVWWSSSLIDKFFCRTFTDGYVRFAKQSLLEKQCYSNYNYYIGRTEWDYAVSRILSPQSKYFHCEELLRPEFYKSIWKYSSTRILTLSTTLNGDIYKGLDTVLRTAGLLKENRVDFIWNIYGVEKNSSLIRIIEKHIGIKTNTVSIFFNGRKDANEIVENLLKSTIYVHPSHADNSPNALCEAMILGVPCIATYVGGIPSLIENEVSGILVPDSDAYFLTHTIMRLYNNVPLLNKLSIGARNLAIKRHDNKKILLQMAEIYSNILNEG